MHFCSFVDAIRKKLHVIERYVTQTIFDNISQHILSQIFDIIQSDVKLRKHVH